MNKGAAGGDAPRPDAVDRRVLLLNRLFIVRLLLTGAVETFLFGDEIIVERL